MRKQSGRGIPALAYHHNYFVYEPMANDGVAGKVSDLYVQNSSSYPLNYENALLLKLTLVDIYMGQIYFQVFHLEISIQLPLFQTFLSSMFLYVSSKSLTTQPTDQYMISIRGSISPLK